MIVIDTSAFSKVLIREEGWEEVVPYLQPEREPYTVEMLITEATNVLWKYVTKYKVFGREKAEELYNAMVELVKEGLLIVEPNSKYLKEALRIAIEREIAVYDALFIAQALSLNAPLVTCDEKQGEKAREIGAEVILIK
ncbi:nucleotide-binding protein [Thermococcus chitonophagus]|uniref:Nucleotide-binding protein n=1 Tax=Thermococcus chitonophagus TaxID=54262 RepID=A0A160VR09_9EURY|nr:type II toxin-antitoxin system VapC family toxin [Thermococcus chitonophagus]ASJ16068.1 nucleotide-binding protein [Thermococcus chitonophagus]CUX77315.1 predicted nucleic acid-binding protein, containing PIN domain [Thermococcus chitonophagus]